MSRQLLSLAVLALVAVALSSAAAVAAPARHPAAPAAPPAAGYSDPFARLGARSPFCARAVGPVARDDCRTSGSIAHAYPLSSYGLDNEVGTSLTDINTNLLAALQDVAALVWLALVFVMKGVLLLLEWGFSIDLLNSAMSAVRSGLATLHRDVLGEPWFLAAIATSGCWGIWRGLVQRRTSETIAGLAGTVALMVAALVLISNPEATVGRASRLADEGSLGIVAATSSGTLAQPEQSFATSLEGVFDSAVLRPWAALEFGDVAWALRPARAGGRVTNADVWLAFPAGGAQRRSLYKLQKGESLDGSGLFGGLGGIATGALTGPLGEAIGFLTGGSDAQLSDAVRSYVHRDPSKVQMQEAGGTFPRLALLALIVLGLLGAVLLFLYIGVKLLLASIMSLLLVLLAPAMLLAPAFGATGRATTIAWSKRLAAAIAAKLVYSLLLAVTLVGSAAIESLQLGWFATWLVLIAFWWGVLLKRRDLLGFAPSPAGPARDAGGGVLRAIYGMRAASWALGGVARVVPHRGAPPALPRSRAPDASAAAEIGRAAGEELEQLFARGEQEEAAAAHSRIGRRAALEEQLRELPSAPGRGDVPSPAERSDLPSPPERGDVPNTSERSDAPNASEQSDAPNASARRRSASAPEPPAGPTRSGAPRRTPPRRRSTRAAPPDPHGAAREELRARLRAASLERRFETPEAAPQGDVARWLERRRADVGDPAIPVDDPRHLEAAGIDPLEYRAADEAERAELRSRAERVIEHDRGEIALAERMSEQPAIDHRLHVRREPD